MRLVRGEGECVGVGMLRSGVVGGVYSKQEERGREGDIEWVQNVEYAVQRFAAVQCSYTSWPTWRTHPLQCFLQALLETCVHHCGDFLESPDRERLTKNFLRPNHTSLRQHCVITRRGHVARMNFVPVPVSLPTHVSNLALSMASEDSAASSDEEVS